MSNEERVKAFVDLHDLVNLYLSERDLPVDDAFFEKVQKHCQALDLDFLVFKEAFGLKDWRDIWGKQS